MVTQQSNLNFGFNVFVPRSRTELAKFAVESNKGNSVLISGFPRSLPPRFLDEHAGKQIIFVDFEKLSKIEEYSANDQVISVECGMKLHELDAFLEDKNQYFPVSLDFGDLTLGEIIDNNDGGLLEHRFGGPRELVLGLETACTIGLIKSGGRVVKNVTGYDLTKLFIGARGTLGMPCLAHLRLATRPEKESALILQAGNFGGLMNMTHEIIQEGLPLSALEIVSPVILRHFATDNESDELRQLVSSRTDLLSPEGFLLLLISGYESEVSEIERHIERILVKNGLKDPLPKTSVDSKLIAKVSALPYKTEIRPVEIAIAPSVVLPFFTYCWKYIKTVGFTYRPSNGKLQLYPHSLEDTVQILLAIKEFTRVKRTSLVVGYTNDRFDRSVVSLPGGDPAAARIKKELRDRFDKNMQLNPCFQI